MYRDYDLPRSIGADLYPRRSVFCAKAEALQQTPSSRL